jgi:hypothetical protein
MTARFLARNITGVIMALGVTALLGVAGCGRAVDMVPLNDAATAAGNPKMDMTLYGTGYGPATVTMPSGEILNGHYRLAVGGAVERGYCPNQLTARARQPAPYMLPPRIGSTRDV